MINKLVDKNRHAIKQAIEIVPVELTLHPNFGNYLLKYGAYTFNINTQICDSLHITFVQGFEEGLKKFSTEDMEEHNTLVINGEVYPGYKDCRIHKGTRNINLAKKTTMQEHRNNRKVEAIQI